MESEQILRELNPFELALENESHKNRLVFPHAFVLSTKIDFFQRIDRLTKSIDYWLSLHPLLQCKIIEKEPGKKFFVLINDQKKLEQEKNVLFLDLVLDSQVQSLSDECKHNCWKLLFEREYHKPLYYPLNKLLWSLKILKLDQKSSSLFNYCFLFNINQAISDGSSVISIIKELCTIIEANFTDTFKSASYDNQVAMYEKEYKCEGVNDPRNVKAPQMGSEKMIEFKLPQYLMPKDAVQCGQIDLRQYEAGLELQKGKFVNVLNKSVYLTVEQIIVESKEKFVTRSEYLVIDNIYKLKAKAEQHGVRLTSCYSIITALAFRKTLQNFSNEANLSTKILFDIAMNLRPYMQPNIDKRVIGSWFCLIKSDLSIDFDETSEEFWSKHFWDLISNNSKLIDVKLKGELDKLEFFDDFAKHTNELVNNFKSNSFNAHFVLSNLGDINDTGLSDSINIREYYRGHSFERELNNSVYTYHAICRVNDKLFWNMSYNAYYMRMEVAKYLMTTISNIISKIV